uniref:PA domain-containing protein n=1 Tax=Ananas comosus var. bracteatus TaxID=296719 RepID=A0A6V7PKV8_ANACO|nr:unnamed protein product [Ananas comosus var. bracteatus]
MLGGQLRPNARVVSNHRAVDIHGRASTMDREFPAYAIFGDKKLKGQSLSPTRLAKNKLYPMVSSKDAKAANQSEKRRVSIKSPNHNPPFHFRFMNILKKDMPIYILGVVLLGSLDPEKVKDKIVVCLRGINARVEKGEAVLEAGGAGMVLANDVTTGNEIIADAHVLPATHITYSDGKVLFSYLQSTQSPRGYITKAITELNTKPAPFMAAFSSQGPNTV